MRPRPHLSSKSLIFTNTSIYTCLKLWFITKTWPRTPIHLLIVCFVGWLTHLGWRGAVKFPILPRKASFLTLKDFSSITTTRSSLLSTNETKSLSVSMSIVHLHMRCSIQSSWTWNWLRSQAQAYPFWLLLFSLAIICENCWQSICSF